jgi:hypothetical protein
MNVDRDPSLSAVNLHYSTLLREEDISEELGILRN